MNKLPALLVATLLLTPNAYATDNTTDSNGDKGLPLMILGLVAKPFLDNMVGKFYTGLGKKQAFLPRIHSSPIVAKAVPIIFKIATRQIIKRLTQQVKVQTIIQPLTHKMLLAWRLAHGLNRHVCLRVKPI